MVGLGHILDLAEGVRLGIHICDSDYVVDVFKHLSLEPSFLGREPQEGRFCYSRWQARCGSGIFIGAFEESLAERWSNRTRQGAAPYARTIQLCSVPVKNIFITLEFNTY